MIALILVANYAQALPSIEDVYERVRNFPGVVVEAEMVTPANVPMVFKLSRGGFLWAKYPSSEEFIESTKSITWMPDRREYSERKREAESPVPIGFEPLWPGAKLLKQVSPSVRVQFQGKTSYQMDCRGDQPYVIHFFADAENLMPRGSRVELNGSTYEIVFRKVKVRPIDPSNLRFVPPKDARISKGGNPNDRLIKAGQKLSSFSVVDSTGRKTSLNSLLKGKDGLVLNFWFSSCTGCVLEMPFLKSLFPKLAKGNIALVGVNPVDQPTVALKTSAKQGLPYRTIVGPGAMKLRDQAGVIVYPVTVVLDRHGVVVDVIPVPDEKLIVAGLKKLSPGLVLK